MCWCTPNLRTPHCGKPECVPLRTPVKRGSYTEKKLWDDLRPILHVPAQRRVAYKVQDAFVVGKPDTFVAWRAWGGARLSVHMELKVVPSMPVRSDYRAIKLKPIQYSTLMELDRAGQVALVVVGIADVRRVAFIPITDVAKTASPAGVRFSVRLQGLETFPMATDAEAVRVSLERVTCTVLGSGWDQASIPMP
jgi:uncharacterized protein YunC (DUF1805 family)